MKQKTNFNEKGITIIALIITIILLLILVGVSINLAIKGNLFGSAEKAVDGTNAKVEQEQTRVDELMGKLNSMKDKEANDSIITEIENGESLIYTAEGGMSTIGDDLQRLNELVVQYGNLTNLESDKKTLMKEIKQIFSEIDDNVTATAFDGENLLNGNIARDIAVRGMFLKIDNLESEALGLNSSNIENELATTESLEAYLNKIHQAMDIVSENRSRVGAVLNGLETLKDFYKEENSILASNEANLDKKIAKNGLIVIKDSLKREIELCNTATGTYIDDSDRKYLKNEMDVLIKVIDIISENCHYNEQKLLDGTYGSISKINSTTLGGGTKLGTDVSTSEKAEALKIQYQNAVNMVENEIAKLGV